MPAAAARPLHLQILRAATAAALGLGCVLGGVLGCDDTTDAPSAAREASLAVSIDLTEPLRCTVLGPAAADAQAALGSRWAQADMQPIDTFLRLPEAESQLEVRIEANGAALPDAFRITIASDEKTAVVAPHLEQGTWRADLTAFDGEVVRLRFEKQIEEPLEWIAPVVVGREVPSPPALTPPTRGTETGPYNIVLYVVDTLRADRMSLYGHARETSPNLVRLGADALVFDAAYANGPSTLATMPAMFSSRHASMLRAQLRPESGLRATFPELLQQAGYRTGGFQANPWVSVKNGFDRGFDEYTVVEGRLRKQGWERPNAAQVTARALQWLDARTGAGTSTGTGTNTGSAPSAAKAQPFFLFMQTMDVHAPYAAPAPFRERFPLLEEPAEPRAKRPIRSEIAKLMAGPLVKNLAGDESRNPGRYEGGIAYADDQFGVFMEALAERGLLENTVVFLTADHGETLGNFDDGTYLHGHSLHEELVRVPLFVQAPWQRDGAAKRIRRPVSVLDLAPTLLEIAGVEPPPETTGRSLFAADRLTCPRAVQGELTDPPHHEGPVAQGPRPVDEWYVREGRWKLLGGPAGRGLFNLEDDPREEHDRRADYPILAAYLAEIRHTSVANGRAARDFRAAVPLGESDQREIDEALRQLGYIE